MRTKQTSKAATPAKNSRITKNTKNRAPSKWGAFKKRNRLPTFLFNKLKLDAPKRKVEDRTLERLKVRYGVKGRKWKKIPRSDDHQGQQSVKRQKQRQPPFIPSSSSDEISIAHDQSAPADRQTAASPKALAACVEDVANDDTKQQLTGSSDAMSKRSAIASAVMPALVGEDQFGRIRSQLLVFKQKSKDNMRLPAENDELKALSNLQKKSSQLNQDRKDAKQNAEANKGRYEDEVRKQAKLWKARNDEIKRKKRENRYLRNAIAKRKNSRHHGEVGQVFQAMASTDQPLKLQQTFSYLRLMLKAAQNSLSDFAYARYCPNSDNEESSKYAFAKVWLAQETSRAACSRIATLLEQLDVSSRTLKSMEIDLAQLNYEKAELEKKVTKAAKLVEKSTKAETDERALKTLANADLDKLRGEYKQLKKDRDGAKAEITPLIKQRDELERCLAEVNMENHWLKDDKQKVLECEASSKCEISTVRRQSEANNGLRTTSENLNNQHAEEDNRTSLDIVTDKIAKLQAEEEDAIRKQYQQMEAPSASAPIPWTPVHSHHASPTENTITPKTPQNGSNRGRAPDRESDAVAGASRPPQQGAVPRSNSPRLEWQHIQTFPAQQQRRDTQIRAAEVPPEPHAAHRVLGCFFDCPTAREMLRKTPNLSRPQLEDMRHIFTHSSDAQTNFDVFTAHVYGGENRNGSIADALASMNPTPAAAQTNSLEEVSIEINWARNLDYTDSLSIGACLQCKTVAEFFSFIEAQMPDELQGVNGNGTRIKEIQAKAHTPLQGMMPRIKRDEGSGRMALKTLIKKLRSQPADAEIELEFLVVWE